MLHLAGNLPVPVGGEGEGFTTLPLLPSLLPNSASREWWREVGQPPLPKPPDSSVVHTSTSTHTHTLATIQEPAHLHCFCKTSHFPHSHTTMGTKLQNVSFLTLACLFLPHPDPASAPPPLTNLAPPPQLESPNSWGSPKRGMTQAPRKGNTLPQADLQQIW